ncbi:unnamed protein product [Medioppia subpectinata]|uniref:Venom dipeptidyl peptidase 4 n=1 Tax=Medioppia subpectinata TaxID=1979941 RepID=A0A7R9KT97_9ACAR|nr:unnamed protein product [Medioppia subpectinata]CAG2108244.1 unnamed protein product [Medioppia subpectinata]
MKSFDNRNSVINENLNEVSNLATISFTGSPNVNRTHGLNNNKDSVDNTGNENANGLTKTHLCRHQMRKCRLSRYLGVLLLIALMAISIAFVAFAIFYDEIIDSEKNESALSSKRGITFTDYMSAPIRLTNTGKDMVIHRYGYVYNGIPDWLYRREIYANSPKLFWLSPVGTKLVYTTIDDSAVDLMIWPFYSTVKLAHGYHNQYPKIEMVRYPKVGRPNPTIALHCIDLTQLRDYNDSIGKLTAHLKPPKDITDYGDHYITTLKWVDDHVVCANWMNRAQNVSNFKLKSSNGWIDYHTASVVTPDGESYLIKVPKMSDNGRDVFPHIAKVSVSPYIIGRYFTATFFTNPGEKHLMSAPLTQSLAAAKAEPVCHTCLINTYTTDKTKTCLVSDATFSEGAKHYIHHCLGPNIPRSVIRRTVDDRLLYTLEDNKRLNNKLKDLSVPKTIFMKVPVGRYQIDVQLFVPQYFDSESKRKYPLVFNVYGGPGAESESVSHKYFYNQFGAYLVLNKSVIYAYLDSRGAPNRGQEFMFEIYRRLGTVEVEDTIAVARYFRDKVPYVDFKSIAIWGWSYGGYLTTKALQDDYNDPVFSCGVAVAPATDWMYTDSVYTERHMGFPTPEDNLQNYRLSSTLDNVKRLNGKQFLLVFGTADVITHNIQAMMLLKAMNEANVKYQTQVYPDQRHGLQQSMAHMYTRMVDFFDQCFNHNIKHK